MGWHILVDNLTTGSLDSYSDALLHTPSDVPLDGVQAIVTDGTAHLGYDRYFHVVDDTGDFWGFSKNETEADILLRYPADKIVQGRTTTTQRFHEVEVTLGRWSPRNKVPSEDWVKDVIGWRVWTSNKVFDSVGVTDWLAHWRDNVPADDIQHMILYENWDHAPGFPYRQTISGGEQYFFAPHPSGKVIISATIEVGDDIAARYPGSVTKLGKFINPSRAATIRQEAHASRTL